MANAVSRWIPFFLLESERVDSGILLNCRHDADSRRSMTWAPLGITESVAPRSWQNSAGLKSARDGLPPAHSESRISESKRNQADSGSWFDGRRRLLSHDPDLDNGQETGFTRKNFCSERQNSGEPKRHKMRDGQVGHRFKSSPPRRIPDHDFLKIGWAIRGIPLRNPKLLPDHNVGGDAKIRSSPIATSVAPRHTLTTGILGFN